MHLRNRSARDRLVVERAEYPSDPPAVGALERRDDMFARERRHAVLQLGELVGDVLRDEIPPRGKNRTELDEDRPQRFQRETEALLAGRREIAPEGERAGRGPHPAKALVAEQELVEPVVERDEPDLREPEPAHPGDCKGSAPQRTTALRAPRFDASAPPA